MFSAMSEPAPSLIAGTRASALARWQTDWVRARLAAAWPGLAWQARAYTTTGDRQPDRPLPEIGGKGVFTEELEQALRRREIDLVVHSLKDLPVEPAPGLVLAAICVREDARDVLISPGGLGLAALLPGARLGTSSVRRSAQLLAARPDLRILPLRGNVDTRLRKAAQGDYDAIVLAAAGVLRLGLAEHIREFLPFDVMLPAPGQGALAIQCRADDDAVRALLAPLDDPATRAAVTAERAFLAALGGGCSAPIAAYAVASARSTPLHIEMRGLAAAPDGRRVVRVSGAGPEPLALGQSLAQSALEQGAADLTR